MMVRSKREDDNRPALLDAVALLADLPKDNLARGQVGTIVESLDKDHVLVEFSDDNGRAYALAPCLLSDLIVLRYGAQAA